MHESVQQFVNKIETDSVPWLPYGLVEGCQFRILKADEASNVVALNFRMGPHTVTQKHGHFCTAMAVTLDGEWMYDDRVFSKGDIAFEVPGEEHQPITREHGAELLTILFGGPGNPRFLHNYEEDGTSYTFGMRFFKALERITPEALAELDLEALLDFEA